ncbi:MAG: hypothetical protein WKF87_01400 [Chryseolinea sp.]
MRTSASCVFLTLLLAVLAPEGVRSAMAQDGSYSLPEDDEGELERERVIYAPGEADPSQNSKILYSASKDSASVRPARSSKPQAEAQKGSGKPASQEDDSILSFNFLYFIFEKYKMQDMVD